MPEIVHEDFSTALLCMYFALAREGKLDPERPRVWLAPTGNGSHRWEELFRLDPKTTEVWMCRHLTRMVLRNLQVVNPFQGLKRALLYSVPQQWLPNPEAEWWQFVRDRETNDEVLRGIISWDDEFVRVLCRALPVPEWFRDKLPNRVDEGRFLAPGQPFWHP